jgi:hypothetical protein
MKIYFVWDCLSLQELPFPAMRQASPVCAPQGSVPHLKSCEGVVALMPSKSPMSSDRVCTRPRPCARLVRLLNGVPGPLLPGGSGSGGDEGEDPPGAPEQATLAGSPGAFPSAGADRLPGITS